MSRATLDHPITVEAHPGSAGTYTLGFLLSILLTLLAYALVVNELFTKTLLVGAVMILATLQLVVQLVLFLHLGRESRPRWNLVAFGFMTMTLIIIVAGSLWIMYNLNYNMMMSPQEMNQYMLEQTKKGF